MSPTRARSFFRLWPVIPIVAVGHYIALSGWLATGLVTMGMPAEYVSWAGISILSFPLQLDWLAQEDLAEITGDLLILGNSLLWGLLAFVLARIAVARARVRTLGLSLGVCAILVPIGVIAWGARLRAEHRRAFEEFVAKAEALPAGTPRADVEAGLGAVPDGPYRFDWRVTYPSYVWVRFEDERLAEVDAVPGYDIPFEVDDWKRASPERRRFMVNALLDSGRLEGISPQACWEVLGAQSDEPMLDYSGVADSGRYRYDLGMDRGWIDSEWLVLEFEDDQLIAARVESD
jgi:hypothetical protein